MVAAPISIVHHWALYAASGPNRPYHLFIDPFPDVRTCNIESAQIVAAGGRSYCSEHLALVVDRLSEERLTWEFLSPSNPWSKICGSRKKG